MRIGRSAVRGSLVTLVALAGIASCSAGTRPDGSRAIPSQASPTAILDRAIEQAGGRDALTRARALTWEGDAIVNAGGRLVQIAGTWMIQPPDTAIVATFDATRGPGSSRSLVVAAPRGWVVTGERFEPMAPAMLANERDEFYLYDVIRLVPLRDAGVRLIPIAPDSLGQAGFRAERAGRPPVDVHVDATGRLAHLRTRVPEPAGGQPVLQDIWLGRIIEASGVRWPRDLRIFLNGEPFFSLTLRALRVHDRIDDPRLRGPG